MNDILKKYLNDKKHSNLEKVFARIDELLFMDKLNNYLVDKKPDMMQKVSLKFINSHYISSTGLIFISTAIIIVVIGAFASINSIPWTSMTPTKYHPLFHPSDMNLKHDCRIIYRDFDGNTSNNKYTSDGMNSSVIFHTCLYMLFVIYALIRLREFKFIAIIMKSIKYETLVLSVFSNFIVCNYLFNSFCRFFRIGSFLIPRYRLTISDDINEVNRVNTLEVNPKYKDIITGKLPFKTESKSIFVNHIEGDKQLLNAFFSPITILSFLISLIITFLFHKFNDSLILTNLQNMNFAIYGIQNLKVSNLRMGSILLTSIFIYDILSVFGKNITSNVITSLNVPYKIILSHNFDNEQENISFYILGLGVIIIPGIFISLCYRYDVWKWHLINIDEEFHLKRSYLGKYFYGSLIGYIIGLFIFIISLNLFQIDRSALFYISPCMLFFVVLLSTINGDFMEFWTFQYNIIELYGSQLNINESRKSYAEFIEELGEEEEEDDDYIEIEDNEKERENISCTYKSTVLSDTFDQTNNDILSSDEDIHSDFD